MSCGAAVQLAVHVGRRQELGMLGSLVSALPLLTSAVAVGCLLKVHPRLSPQAEMAAVFLEGCEQQHVERRARLTEGVTDTAVQACGLLPLCQRTHSSGKSQPLPFQLLPSSGPGSFVYASCRWAGQVSTAGGCPPGSGLLAPLLSPPHQALLAALLSTEAFWAL